MEIRGRVQNGVVVLEGGAVLPEGTAVTVLCDTTRISRKPRPKKRVEFPLVRTGEPGTLNLTADRIAEILEEEDLAAYRRSLGQPTTVHDSETKPPSP